MDLSVIEVPPELFVIAESSSFSGDIALEELAAGPDVYQFDEPVSWSATITNTGDALLVMGRAKAHAKTQCARCLEDFSIELEGDIEGYFLLSEDGPRPDDMDDDEFEVLPSDHKIDLEPLVVAALLIDMPLIPLCDEDCKGLCSGCGANLNTEKCTCGADDANNVPRMSDGRISPFAALKDLDLER